MKKREALRGRIGATEEKEVQPHDVWDASLVGLDIELVMFYVEECIQRKRMSAEATDDYINSRTHVDDSDYFIRVDYVSKNHIEVFYKHKGAKIGFQCAVSGLRQFRLDIKRDRKAARKAQEALNGKA